MTTYYIFSNRQNSKRKDLIHLILIKKITLNTINLNIIIIITKNLTYMYIDLKKEFFDLDILKILQQLIVFLTTS